MGQVHAERSSDLFSRGPAIAHGLELGVARKGNRYLKDLALQVCGGFLGSVTGAQNQPSDDLWSPSERRDCGYFPEEVAIRRGEGEGPRRREWRQLEAEESRSRGKECGSIVD